MGFVAKFKQIKTWGFRGTVDAASRMFAERSVRRFLVENMRENHMTVPSRGITVVAPMSGAHSLSKAMRDFVVRLHDAGIPCQVFDSFREGARARNEDYEALITDPSKFNILRYSHVVEMFNSPLPAGLPVKRCRIAFWEGEAGILEVFPYLVDSDTVIAMSDFNAAYFRRELPQSVRVAKITYPLIPTPDGIPAKCESRRHFGIPEDAFVVFYNFDMRSAGRKNPEGTVAAFASAFGGDAHSRLLLKINGAIRSRDKMESLLAQAKNLGVQSQLQIVTEYLTQEDIYALTNACDVYMSLHRAEGFGLGIAEAMSLGKAVVATDYSSTTEFCRQETALLVPYRKTPILAEDFCRHMKEWAEPDVNAAAEALKRLRDNDALRERLGKNAKDFISSYFSVGSFRRSVEELLS